MVDIADGLAQGCGKATVGRGLVWRGKVWLGVASLAMSAGLAGCASYAVGVQHDRTLLPKLSEVAVAWVPKDDIAIHVQRSDPLATVPITGKDSKAPVYETYRPPPEITDRDRRDAAANARRIMGLYRLQVEDRLAQALRARGVTVLESGAAGVPRLQVTPLHASSECVPLGCTDSLWLQVRVLVGPQATESWSARIRSSTSWPKPVNESMVADFVDTLLRNLKDSALL